MTRRNRPSARPGFAVFLPVLAALATGCGAVPARAPAAMPPSARAPSVTPVSDPVLPHQTFTIDSRVMGEPRLVNVYTPPGYDGAPDARHPVLYMPDGGVDEDFPHVTNDVEAAIRAGEMRPVIVVGIVNTERRRDMTGPTEVAKDRTIAPRVGGSAAFRAFIRDELMPEVGRRVRVGYWIGKEFWGQGIATRALEAFLEVVPARPLYAHVARSNRGSIRVLEKCGFRTSDEHGEPSSVGADGIEDVVMKLPE